MQDIKTLFTAIGDFFAKTDWFVLVQWPFWTLLCTVAVGGVYCARFGKKTLFNQGVTGILNLLFIYLSATLAYIYLPALRSMSFQLPFLVANKESLRILDPLSVDHAVLTPELLRLALLILMVNLCDTFCSGGKTVITWFFSHVATTALGLLFYILLTAGFSVFVPLDLSRYAFIPVVLTIAFGLFMLFLKFFFTAFITGGNPTFSAVYRFFTVKKFGSLLTTSSLTFLLSMAVVAGMHSSENTRILYHRVNTNVLWSTLLILLPVLYVFSMFFNDRKKS